MTTELTELKEISLQDEIIAQAMVRHTGNLSKVSREKAVEFNAMSLRRHVADNPSIRLRYQELLTEKLQESGLQIGERILKLVQLQEKAYGTDSVPTDVKAVIDISKHISELIRESKGLNVSDRSAVLITSKEDASELLKDFLNS